jgi:hypothetical protein
MFYRLILERMKKFWRIAEIVGYTGVIICGLMMWGAIFAAPQFVTYDLPGGLGLIVFGLLAGQAKAKLGKP